jgi:hypothetical protein
MTPDTPELQAIVERLSKLEGQNRRLKRGGAAILAALSTLVLMGQAAPSPRVVEAQRFVLKDANGNVRGWMGVIGKGSELTLGNVNAQPMMGLMVSEDSSDLHFFGSRKSGMTLGVNSGDPALSMMGAEGIGGAGITIAKDGPSLTLQDGRGFSAVVGTAQLETPTNGKTHQTSAASVVLFDKGKKVIWQAPLLCRGNRKGRGTPPENLKFTRSVTITNQRTQHEGKHSDLISLIFPRTFRQRRTHPETRFALALGFLCQVSTDTTFCIPQSNKISGAQTRLTYFLAHLIL